MRNISPTLAAFLQNNKHFTSADLYLISMTTGQTIALTTYTQNLVFGGSTYLATGMVIKRDAWSVKYTQEVPVLSFDLYSSGVDFVSSGQTLNFKTLVHQGILDYAYVQLSRAFIDDSGSVVGTVLLFGGRTSTVQLTALGAQITAKGDNVLMQQYMPRNTYQLGCIHALYDAGCTLVRSSFSITQGIGASGITSLFLPWSSAPSTPSLYTTGIVEITSGAAEGQTMSILQANGGGVSLLYPLYNLPSPGDTMVVSRGCAKTRAACTTFSNLTHYRGFENIPPVETAY